MDPNSDDQYIQNRRTMVPNWNLQLVVGPKDVRRLMFRVQSRTVGNASEALQQLLSDNPKGRTLREGIHWTIHMPDDDPTGMELAMNIIHRQFHLLPVYIKTPALYRLVLVCRKYGLTHLLGPWAKVWLSIPSTMIDNASIAFQLIFVAWELGEAAVIRYAAVALVFDARLNEEARKPYWLDDEGEVLLTPVDADPDSSSGNENAQSSSRRSYAQYNTADWSDRIRRTRNQINDELSHHMRTELDVRKVSDTYRPPRYLIGWGPDEAEVRCMKAIHQAIKSGLEADPYILRPDRRPGLPNPTSPNQLVRRMRHLFGQCPVAPSHEGCSPNVGLNMLVAELEKQCYASFLTEEELEKISQNGQRLDREWHIL